MSQMCAPGDRRSIGNAPTKLQPPPLLTPGSRAEKSPETRETMRARRHTVPTGPSLRIRPLPRVAALRPRYAAAQISNFAEKHARWHTRSTVVGAPKNDPAMGAAPFPGRAESRGTRSQRISRLNAGAWALGLQAKAPENRPPYPERTAILHPAPFSFCHGRHPMRPTVHSEPPWRKRPPHPFGALDQRQDGAAVCDRPGHVAAPNPTGRTGGWRGRGRPRCRLRSFRNLHASSPTRGPPAFPGRRAAPPTFSPSH